MSLIPIRSYSNYFDAALAQGVLESAGIHCFLQDVHSVTINPVLTNAMGGIKLNVRQEDLAEAEQLLRPAEINISQPVCPACGSADTQLAVRLPAKTWLSLLISAIRSSSFSHEGQLHYQCKDCRMTFRD